MTERKEPKDMNLGELVEALIIATVNYATGQWASDSPYKSKEEYNKEFSEEYLKITNKLREELDKRERVYKHKQFHKVK